ncbi:MAG: HAMP domain-containing protein [Gemmatimonadaceae bacterium]|nr:HAMP domain-containing protein [Gemmatimonadaceae bacterium]
MFSSLRARLALWHSLLLGVPLICFAIVSYVAFARALVGGTDRFIGEALAAFTQELGAERRAGLTTQQAMLTTVYEVRFRELHIMIVDAEGRIVAMASPPDTLRPRSWAGATPATPTVSDPDNATLLAALQRDGRLREPVIQTFDNLPTGEAFRVHAQPLTVAGEYFLLTGRYPLRDTERTMASIRRIFLLTIPLLVLAAAVSGYFLARRNLAPVAHMAERAAAISANTLHERLPVSGGEELVRLAEVVNALLNRLEASFEQQRRFMADASHELRTPTAIVRTEADVTLTKAHRTEDEYRASVGIMQDASRRLTRIVDDLFLLARSDAGHLVVHRAPIYLEDVVDDAVRAARPLAERRGVSLVLGNMVEASVDGDADLLGRLLLNLVDNAIKHTPQGATVHVAMSQDTSTASVTVRDEGTGIPEAAQAHVFERFFRADAARTRDENSHTSGAGLGLSIARRIADVHDGTLLLIASRPGHTEFRFTVPLRGPHARAV